MTVRSVFNPNNHTWEDVPNLSLRRFIRHWFSLLGWKRSTEKPRVIVKEPMFLQVPESLWRGENL